MRFSRYLILALICILPLTSWAQRNRLVKPRMTDTVRLHVYADNWFALYINGNLVAVDPIPFMPHNVVSVDVLPVYPMTIAVLAKDNADATTGMEYGNNIGDAGFILKLGDDIITNESWRARAFSHGPIGGNRTSPEVTHTPLPPQWWLANFDDSDWDYATLFTVREVGPKAVFNPTDFSGAKFIWTKSLELDNTVIFRTRIEKPDWQKRWNTTPDIDVSNTPNS